MAKYIINKGYGNEETIEADSLSVGEFWATFTTSGGSILYAVPYGQVQSIEKEGVAV